MSFDCINLSEVTDRDPQKEDVNNHIKQIGLSYTYVDVGWWYQISYPRLPSGKIDYAAAPVMNMLCKDGNTPSALTDLRDIGHYIAKIIVDERTENKYVLVYNEVWTFNKVWDLVEKLSGEQLDRQYVSLISVCNGYGESSG